MQLESLEGRQLMASVTQFLLVNADTGATLATVKQGSTIDLAKLPTQHLSVRALATRDTQSVVFNLNGSKHLENVEPYSLAGDYYSHGAWHYNVVPFNEQTYRLSATAYTRDRALGNHGRTLFVNFKVIN
ncbi:MAG: hypothetical protein ACTHM6_07710, partial [Tepidisphaeraceae bacterium]